MRKAYRRNTSLQQEDCFPNSHRPYCVFVDVWVLFPLFFMNSVIFTRWKSDSILKFLTVAKAFYYYFSDMSHTF